MMLQQQNRHQAKIAIVIAIVLALALNVVSYQLSYRFDLTDNGDYSLSPATRALLSKIKDTVIIKAYFTENLPGYLAAGNRAVRDLLSEYQKASGGKIVVTYADPAKDNTAAQEAAKEGIPPLRFNVVQKDKYEVTNGYLGLAVIFKDKKQVIPMVETTATLEYDLGAAVSRVTADKTPTIGIATGEATRLSPQDDFRLMTDWWRRQYFVIEFEFSGNEPVPSDVDVLILPGIVRTLAKREQYVLDQFLQRGGGLAIFSEGVRVDLSNLSASAAPTGLEDLLAAWGVKLNNNLVMDAANELQGFRSEFQQFFLPYPPLVKAVKGGFNRESGLVNKLEGVVFPFVSSVEIWREKLTDKTKAVALVSTTDRAWLQENSFILAPQAIPLPTVTGAKTLAVMLTGRFSSAFRRETIPPLEGNKIVAKDDKDNFRESTDNGRLVVVGDADFLTDQYVQRLPANAALAGNLVDALAGDEGLISIRSKTTTDRPLRQLSESARSGIKWANILGMSVLFALYGLARSIRRKKSLFVD